MMLRWLRWLRPLLEAGAIDGARGILINITGSSNLKLSEVNEASTIIQNAAHEDATSSSARCRMSDGR